MMNLPADFESRTRCLLGDDEYTDFREALERETPVSIRMNGCKCPDVPQGVPVPWCPSGYYLETRPTFTFDPLFHAGCYYVQEASSMFVEQALRQYVHAPVAMLDLCAAPGGKSTLARSALPEGSLLVANEVMRNRSQVLAENLIKWGHPGVIVTNNDPRDFAPLRHTFDVILSDVPCSGEGMFRKDPVAVEEWSVENVQLCWQRQRRILADIWDCLKPGGILIYSTCTFNTEENEENVAWIVNELGAEVLPLAIDSAWHITGNLSGGGFPVFRFLPHRTTGEGLFLAVLRKHDGETENSTERYRKKDKKNKGGKSASANVAFPQDVKRWISQSKSFSFSVEANRLTAFPTAWQPIFDIIKSTLKVLHAGVPLAEVKGKDCVPEHSLALSSVFNRSTFPCAPLTYGQAIAYLRKEAVALSPDTPRGYVCVTYKDIPLGFAKNIGNRANNLYPQEWRIRSGYMPEKIIPALDNLCM